MSLAPPPFVDGHVHFWSPSRLRYPWLADVPAIAAEHGPGELRAEASGGAPTAVVFVQAECERAQWHAEVRWVEALAAEDATVAGIVAFAPLDEPCEGRAAIAELARHPLVRGVRRLLQDAPDPELCRNPAFIDGVRRVGEAGLVFDLCARAPQLSRVLTLVRACPATRFVLDHGGKPELRGDLAAWREDVARLADEPNVVAKLSGLVAEADPSLPLAPQVAPAVTHLLACFGADRLLFGSDWPVLKLAHDYPGWLDLARQLTAHLEPAAREGIFSTTARRTYRLP